MTMTNLEQALPATNKYKLIYPSVNHPPSSIAVLLQHATRIYEQFTGSVNPVKMQAADIEAKVKELRAQILASAENISSRT
jgi:hypothetical protein